MRHKKVRTVTGLEYFYPNARVSGRSGYVTGTTNIFNYPIQGLATAELIPIAVTYLHYRLKGMKSFIINTVHDSAIIELHPEEEEQVREIAAKCFTHCVYHYLYKVCGVKFNVPLGTGFTSGTNWDWDRYSEGNKVTEVTKQVEPPQEYK